MEERLLLSIKRWNSWDKTFEDEIDGKEITDYINEWMQKNTVQGRFNMTDATDNMIRFEQVRIPIYDKNNQALDARQFAKGLQKYLKSNPFNFGVKLMTRGLGEAILVLGEKYNMKIFIFLFLFLIAVSVPIKSQPKLDDFGRIVLNYIYSSTN